MNTIRTRLLLPAVLIVCSVGGSLQAETFVFRNECRVPLVVQVSSVQRGVLKRDQGLLRPGESTAKLPLDSDKVITVYDSRSSRILFRDVLKVRRQPAWFILEPDPRFPARLRISEVRQADMERPPSGKR